MASIAYQLTLVDRPTHLHAAVVGERTPANAQRYLAEVYAACVERGYSTVLLDVQFSGPGLSVDTLSRLIAARAADGAKFRKIAYVARWLDDLATAYAAESEGISRGINVRAFRDLASAERWLAKDWRVARAMQ